VCQRPAAVSAPAAAGAKGLDLASLGRRYVVGAAADLADQPLLLHLAAELTQG
jgi:hypothetical protein